MAEVQVALPVPVPFSQTPDIVQAVEPPNSVGLSEETTVPEPSEEETVVSADEAQPSDSIEEGATSDERSGTPEWPSLTSLLEDSDLEFVPFPFSEEDEIETGTVYIGFYTAYQPASIESLMPFFGVPDNFESLREVIPNGNLVSFFHGTNYHEYYRNYLRGDTMKQLRTSNEFKQGAPGALQKMFDLPLELLFDILELVHPIDLLHLYRSTKLMKELLLTNRAEEVWAASYRNHADHITQLPEAIPALHWTAMLYSSARCDFCGRLGALMDFAFKERYCDDCQTQLMDERQVVSLRFEESHPRELEDLYQLLIPTYRQCGRKYQTMYESDENARFRKKDIEEMIQALRTWYMTIDEGVFPDAGQRFEEWKEKRKREVKQITIAASQANNWAVNVSYTRSNEYIHQQQKLSEKIAARLAKMGYDTRDTEPAANDIYYVLRVNDVHKMNVRTFETYKRDFISKVENNKRIRIRKERREKSTQAYKDYKKTVKPERWAYMPPTDTVLYEEPFNAFINAPLEEIPELSMTEVIAKLPVFIEQWIGDRRLEFYQIIPGAEMPTTEEETEEGLSDEERESRAQGRDLSQKEILSVLMDQRMSLATTVHSCVNCKSGRHSSMALIGWDECCAHLCGSFPGWYHTNFEFCSVGYAAAANIIRTLGLNPETATIAEVDAVDARFFCMNCPVTLHRRVRGRKAYTWRECVQHAVEKEEDHTHAIPSWIRLSNEATEFVKVHESPAPLWRKANWGCNHCPEHLETPVHVKEVIEHVKTTHSVEAPVYGVDYIDFKNRYEKGGHYRRRHIFHFGVEPTCNLTCKLCRFGKVKRMWTIQDLVPHLFHKHGISMPSSSRDYLKIPVFYGD